MNAWFDEDTSVMNVEQFQKLYYEYIDLSGSAFNKDFEKKAHINYLITRTNSVKLFINLQREFVKDFDICYKPNLSFLSNFGYTFKWENKEQFLKLLNKIESKEQKYIIQLEELAASISEEHNEEEKQTRKGFMSNIISLRKNGYEVNLNETTVEELALSIKHSIDEYNNYKNKT